VVAPVKLKLVQRKLRLLDPSRRHDSSLMASALRSISPAARLRAITSMIGASAGGWARPPAI
jgi:hypothetical protein